jgi:hypothetical protein
MPEHCGANGGPQEHQQGRSCTPDEQQPGEEHPGKEEREYWQEGHPGPPGEAVLEACFHGSWKLNWEAHSWFRFWPTEACCGRRSFGPEVGVSQSFLILCVSLGRRALEESLGRLCQRQPEHKPAES